MLISGFEVPIYSARITRKGVAAVIPVVEFVSKEGTGTKTGRSRKFGNKKKKNKQQHKHRVIFTFYNGGGVGFIGRMQMGNNIYLPCSHSKRFFSRASNYGHLQSSSHDAFRIKTLISNFFFF